MPDGIAEGVETTDQMCLDKDENICLVDYDFVWANHKFEYPKVKNIKVGGVIPFNRYGVSSNDPYIQGKRLIYDLLNEDVFFNSTMQFDFNQ